jgi:hypothetical protein
LPTNGREPENPYAPFEQASQASSGFPNRTWHARVLP